MIYRQGDIIFKKISEEEFKERAKKFKKKIFKNQFIVARGEATGHAHKLVDFEKIIVLQDTEGKFYLNLPQNTKLIHEEHLPIELESGYYQVLKEKEYDYFLEEIRKILD
jgi:hypothetical protein